MLSILNIGTMTATHDGDVLKIIFNDGTYIGVLLKNRPVITFTTDSLVLDADDFQMAVPKSYTDIEKIVFEDNAITGIEQPTADNHGLQITYLDGENVVISGVNDKMPWRVYGLDGKQYQVNANLAGNMLTISLSSLVNGVYIIRIDNYSFKIRKK